MKLTLRISILLVLLCFLLCGCPLSDASYPSSAASGTLPAATLPDAESTVPSTAEPTVLPTTEPTVPSTMEPTVPPTTELTVPPTTAPTVLPATNDEMTNLVWIPKTGKKYHAKETCSGMKGPSQVSKEEAENREYEPCKRCYS